MLLDSIICVYNNYETSNSSALNGTGFVHISQDLKVTILLLFIINNSKYKDKILNRRAATIEVIIFYLHADRWQ